MVLRCWCNCSNKDTAVSSADALVVAVHALFKLVRTSCLLCIWVCAVAGGMFGEAFSQPLCGGLLWCSLPLL